MKLLEATAAISLALLLAAAGIAEDSQPTAGDALGTGPEAAAQSIVDQTLAEVLAILDDAALTPDQRVASIEKIVRDHFDVDEVARLTLGKSKSRFSPPQATSYACEFEPYLSNYIASRLSSYQQEKVEIVSAKRQRSHVIVHTRIRGGKFANAAVDFRMRETGNQWRAIDVRFEGVSLVLNLRAQFKELLSNGGPEELLQTLGEKNGSRSDC